MYIDQEKQNDIAQTFDSSSDLEESFQTPKCDSCQFIGCPQFVNLSALDKICYVKNNVMYIKFLFNSQ